MKTGLRRLAVMALTTGTIAACAGGMRQTARGPAPIPNAARDAGDGPAIITTNLTYHRPELFQSAERPGPFHVVPDYTRQSTASEYPGNWDDDAQTLSATVNVPLRAENLVYLSDSALTPGAAMRVTALRGTLKEVTCPAGVDPLNTCLLLQVLR